MTGGVIVCGQRLVEFGSFGQDDGRCCVVKRHLTERSEQGGQEVSKKPQNPTTYYVGPERVWCWEVTRRRGEFVVHHQVITRERTANTR